MSEHNPPEIQSQDNQPELEITGGNSRLRALLRRLRQEPQRLEILDDGEDAFVMGLRALKDEFQIPDGVSVMYPGSSTHVGVARVFGKEAVTHIDPDEHAVEALDRNGYKTAKCGIEEYLPVERHDGLIALNSYGRPTDEVLSKTLKPGGFIIANNYTHWAHMLQALSGVTLEAAMLPAYNHNPEIKEATKYLQTLPARQWSIRLLSPVVWSRRELRTIIHLRKKCLSIQTHSLCLDITLTCLQVLSTHCFYNNVT